MEATNLGHCRLLQLRIGASGAVLLGYIMMDDVSCENRCNVFLLGSGYEDSSLHGASQSFWLKHAQPVLVRKPFIFVKDFQEEQMLQFPRMPSQVTESPRRALPLAFASGSVFLYPWPMYIFAKSRSVSTLGPRRWCFLREWEIKTTQQGIPERLVLDGLLRSYTLRSILVAMGNSSTD